MAVTVLLPCELDTLCELWYFDVYRLDLPSNHVAVIAVVQCFDHEGLQFGMFTVAWASATSLSVCHMISLEDYFAAIFKASQNKHFEYLIYLVAQELCHYILW